MNEYEISTAISRLDTIPMPYGAEKEIEFMISDKLDKMGIYHHSTSRVKTKESLSHKIGTGKYTTDKRSDDYSIENSKKIQDLIGIKILVYFVEDLNIVEKVLEDMFGKAAWSKSVHRSGEFDPTKVNGVFSLERALRVTSSDDWHSICVDETFEVQIKTVLFQSWHEIEHDMRYKNKEIWHNFEKIERKFNSILATLELCDDSVTSVLEDLSYNCYKMSQEKSEDGIDRGFWYLENIIKTHFRIKLQSTRKVFAEFLDETSMEYDLQLDEAIEKCDGRTLFKRYLSWKLNNLNKDEIEHLATVFSSKDFMRRVIKSKRNSVVSKLIDYDSLPLNVFTLSILIYLNYYQYGKDNVDERINEPENLNAIKDRLGLFLSKEMPYNPNTGKKISRFKTYPIFQRCFDVYPSQNNNGGKDSKDIFKKSFNYIKRWLAAKLDDYDFADEEKDGFNKFYSVFENDGQEFNEDKYEFTLSSEYDIRALYVPDLKTAAIKIAEPGGDSERGERQFGRFFFTNISVKDNGDFVELAVKVECQEPERNIIKAGSTRPLFIYDIYMDEDVEVSEHSIPLDFKWLKQTDDRGKFSTVPYIINSSFADEAKKINNSLFDCRRDILPVLFANTDKLNDISLPEHASKSRFSMNYLTDRMFGYAHVVAFDNDAVGYLKDTFKKNDNFVNALEACPLFVVVDRGYVIEKFEVDISRGYTGFLKKVDDYIRIMMTERSYSFDDVLFFRELKNAYYKLKSNETDTIIGLEKEIEELKKSYEQKINDLTRKLNEKRK